MKLKRVKKTISSVAALGILLFLFSCGDPPVPKPRGYFRIDLPEKNYQEYDSRCPFSFELPSYSKIEIVPSDSLDSCWFNVAFPRHKAKLHMTYLAVDSNFHQLLEDSYSFAFSHEMKANAITRTDFYDPEAHVSGLVYDIRGDVASNLQFFATDSNRHFVRGALYFNVKPNEDSLAPVVDYIRDDVVRMMETIRWD